MKLGFCIAAFLMLSLSSATGQQVSFQDSLLDRLTGKWILQGTIAGDQTTHDVTAKWVLAHNYFQIHETSREKNQDGNPLYEAIVYIGWDEQMREYQCLWLDVTGGGGLSGQAIGLGKCEGDSISFLFQGPDGSLFHTTFALDRVNAAWEWLMDGEENGALQPFARLRLTRE